MSMDIGAIQQGSGIDIGAVESAEAAPTPTGSQYISIANAMSMWMLIIIFIAVVGHTLGARRNGTR